MVSAFRMQERHPTSLIAHGHMCVMASFDTSMHDGTGANSNTRSSLHTAVESTARMPYVYDARSSGSTLTSLT